MTEEDTFNGRNNMIEQLKKIINDNPDRNNYLGLVNTIVNRELYEWIIQQHPKIENINEKIYLLLKTPKVCDYDNEKPFRDFIKGYGYCGNASNCACLYEVSSRTNAWMKDKTKVKNASKKRKETNIEIYGCENPSGNADVKEKKKQTSQKNWGTDNPMQNSDVVDILEASNLETYGVINPAMDSAIIERGKQTKYKNGTAVPPELKDPFEQYSYSARILSEKIYKKYKNKINPDNVRRGRNGYHLDHKVSIKDGFINNVPIEIISNEYNLQMLSGSENQIKNSKSDISIMELYRRISDKY